MRPRWDLLTLHPDLLAPMVGGSILGRAREAGLIDIAVHDIREHADGRHRQADDAPFGGGAGMVMKVDVVGRALDALRTPASHVVITSPTGRVFSQAIAVELSLRPHVIVLCGHYEGIDARIETLVDEAISLGDFVLTGGEIAAAAFADAALRLVPGVLGNEASAAEESFSDGLLEYPQYTRPRSWRGLDVPDVLLSGHHGRIAAWRREQAEERTRRLRPDLWERALRARAGVDETAGEE